MFKSAEDFLILVGHSDRTGSLGIMVRWFSTFQIDGAHMKSHSSRGREIGTVFQTVSFKSYVVGTINCNEVFLIREINNYLQLCLLLFIELQKQFPYLMKS